MVCLLPPYPHSSHQPSKVSNPWVGISSLQRKVVKWHLPRSSLSPFRASCFESDAQESQQFCSQRRNSVDEVINTSNYHTTALISHTSKVVLKILQARLQQDINSELPGLEDLVLEKAEEPEIKLPTSAGSWKKQESSRNTSISALLIMPKPLTVWITINCGKF